MTSLINNYVMDDGEIQSPLKTTAYLWALSGMEPDSAKQLVNPAEPCKAPRRRSRCNEELRGLGGALSPGSSCSDTSVDGLPNLPTRLSSVGEQPLFADEGPELNIDIVHQLIGSPRYHTPCGVPRPKILAYISGTGLAPWEIHRPQKFVRDLVLRRAFSGRVLDAGCGIGDNALYVAKAAPGAEVTAVDVIPRCLDFVSAKANLRDMRGKVALEVADLQDTDPARLPTALGSAADASFDVALDSLTFHCFCDCDRERYVATLRRLLRPGGVIYMNCMSEEETRPGGPRRITVADLRTVFSRSSGWEVTAAEDSVIEFHPSFWGGQAKARLFTIHKL